MLSLLPADARDERQLLARLRDGDPLALAALYNRTALAAHTCASRLLGDPREVEALLAQVYRELWSQPPEVDECTEGWVRRRCFALGATHLQAVGAAPAASSTAMLLPTAITGGGGSGEDRPAAVPASEVEGRIAALAAGRRMALLRAVDAGIPSGQQRAWVSGTGDGDGDPPRALVAALRELAEADTPVAEHGCEEPRLGDWVLGLLDVAEAEAVSEAVSQHAGCASEAEVLRAGRRRLDGPPPPAELGPRVIAAALAGGSGALAMRAPVRAEAAGPLGTPPRDRAAVETPAPAEGPGTERGEAQARAEQAQAEQHRTEQAQAEQAELAQPQAQRTEAEAQAEAPAEPPQAGSTAGHFLRTVLGMLLLLLGAAVGLYVGQAIVATL